jgi:hypothetical protein
MASLLRSTKPKRTNKLAVPEWFDLQTYDSLRSLTTPRDWLKQLAFRIDLRNFWKEIAHYHFDRSAHNTGGWFEGDLAFEQIFEQIKQSATLAVDELVKQHSCSIDFATVRLVNKGHEPVRPITLTDLCFIYSMLNSEKRSFIKHLFDCIDQGSPYPVNKIYFARYNDADKYKFNEKPPRISHEHEAIEEYIDSFISLLSRLKNSDSKIRVLDTVLGKGEVDANPGFLHDAIDDHIYGGFSSFFILDANVPYEQAKHHFEKCYEGCQDKTSGKTIDKELYDLWITNGVLPYIDLQLYVEIEKEFHKNHKMKITNSELARNIYPEGRMRDDPDRVSDTTKPEAEKLMDPTSVRFRQLLFAAHNCQMNENPT